ncbi:MAG: patatin-like phospholipase family protein [Deltaproteobacteria bacterium]|nr:patatin-like phospholipase family protein [Deltaproteobacteria bacterium]
MSVETAASRLQNKKCALSMSSGFFGFYHHAGVLKALAQKGVKPVKVSGTSAGSIVAALYAAGVDADTICKKLLQIKRKDFWDIQFPFTKNGFGWLAGERFAKILDEMLPVKEFSQCNIPLHVGVYQMETGRSRQLSDGNMVQAVRASCAVPYLFSPVKINNSLYWDGGFAEKTPLGKYVNDTDIETVIISLMPPREEHGGKKVKKGLLSGVKFFADIPLQERIERDKKAVQLIKESNKEVFTLSPKRVWLGPFSLEKAEESINYAYEQTIKILESQAGQV